MKTKNISFFYFFIFIFSILILTNSINRYLNPDEFEHIHSAWYIQNGYIPYSDFFENHHPLLWFMLAPFLTLFGYTVKTIIIIRLFILAFFFGIIFLIYHITKITTKSIEASRISVILLLSVVIFVEKSIEIRPDVPQVFFGLYSIYYLLNFFKDKEKKHIILSGLFASISFLFLQKTLFLIMIYIIIFISKLLKSKISLVFIWTFILSFVVPLLIFGLYLVITESFNAYLLNTWMFHISHLRSFSALLSFQNTIKNNSAFWLLSILAVIYLLFKNKKTEMRFITTIGIFLFISIFIVKHPFTQYFMFPTSILCITNGYFLNEMFNKYKISIRQKIAILIFLTFIPFIALCRFTFITTNQAQLEKIKFVLENSRNSDLVYDGCAKFNLFRKDLHYFWFSVSKGWGLDTYNKITNNKYGNYNICALIKEKKPRIISNYRLNIKECGLDKQYKKTRYNDLYIRSQ